MLSFCLDIFFLLVSSVNLQEQQSETAKVLMPTLALANYGMYGLCQIILSKNLQTELLKLLDSLLLMPLFCRILSCFNFIGMFKSLSAEVHVVRSSYLSVAHNTAAQE